MARDETENKLDEALNQTFPASDPFYISPPPAGDAVDNEVRSRIDDRSEPARDKEETEPHSQPDDTTNLHNHSL